MPDVPAPLTLSGEISLHLEFLEEVAEERKDPARLGNVYEEFCTHYRALGICLLSGDGDVDGFFDCLVQSALTRRHYLDSVSRSGGGEPRYRRASFVDPALDAIAARQWTLAGEVFARAAQMWMEGEEYEDDFCYAESLRRLTMQSRNGLDELLQRWEDVLEGGSDIRLDVIRALQSREEGDFAEALLALLEREEAEARAIADPVEGSLRAYEATFFPNKWISIEGLAILAIAERLGMRTPEVVPHCPPLARSKVFKPFQPRGYPHVQFSRE